jgi:hypothetical protein
LTPAIASWNAAMPPAAPLPTTMTSQRSLPGLIDSASRFDSSSARVRLTLSVGSSCIVVSGISDFRVQISDLFADFPISSSWILKSI